jgi:hypothetical protein
MMGKYEAKQPKGQGITGGPAAIPNSRIIRGLARNGK